MHIEAFQFVFDSFSQGFSGRVFVRKVFREKEGVLDLVSDSYMVQDIRGGRT